MLTTCTNCKQPDIITRLRDNSQYVKEHLTINVTDLIKCGLRNFLEIDVGTCLLTIASNIANS